MNVTRASENDVITKWLTLMCGVFYGKIVIHSSVGTKNVQEKESIISVRYGQTNLSVPHTHVRFLQYIKFFDGQRKVKNYNFESSVFSV